MQPCTFRKKINSTCWQGFISQLWLIYLCGFPSLFLFQCESSLVGPPARCWCVSSWNGKKIPGSGDLLDDSECHQEVTHWRNGLAHKHKQTCSMASKSGKWCKINHLMNCNQSQENVTAYIWRGEISSRFYFHDVCIYQDLFIQCLYILPRINRFVIFRFFICLPIFCDCK